ncbi:MAG: DUF2274 domain-containing protein [Rhodospirillaceae bacterium]|nr:DUF2274 domain-containing protein [Rhodospirillaceae bacterium]
MPELKLAKLPDRTPVKIVISVSPDLNKALQGYAELYRQTYGSEEAVPELIPFMLETFLDGDRGFKAALKGQKVMMNEQPSSKNRRQVASESAQR